MYPITIRSLRVHCISSPQAVMEANRSGIQGRQKRQENNIQGWFRPVRSGSSMHLSFVMISIAPHWRIHPLPECSLLALATVSTFGLNFLVFNIHPFVTNTLQTTFEVSHPETITCVAFKQTKSRRLSERFGNVEIDTEDLAVGDDSGTIWYYSVEWADESTRNEYDWQGSMTLLAKITAHSQQVCGITWSPDGNYMATGGNDNACLIFELHEIIPAHELGIVEGCCPSTDAQGTNVFSSFSARTSRQILGRYRFVSHLFPSWNRYRTEPLSTSLLSFTGSLVSGGDRTTLVPPNRQKHKLIHSAAVKAIAFAPWQPSLLATGGGSNDRAIHFYHTPSGACLATISVYAQVTSLIWSRTRREIAATFGFAQPEHPFRIAVFAWPSCEQIAAVPWGPYGSSWDGPENHSFGDCGRALCAVSYPGRPPTYPGRPVEPKRTKCTLSAEQPTGNYATPGEGGRIMVLAYYGGRMHHRGV
ncbi:hypothetical protein EYZ11_004912 [Aspergillus tanneri]|uniref:Uncharacterized protein n=1 Tax=Aspergillus tanneri TaxID=1220188 RepID=A0A4S3JLL1_9EURO|nr:hypothetical protein EYZ11_004912 [Aspergillus tanneri]